MTTRRALINWNDPEEIIAHRFSLVDILGMHPKVHQEVFDKTSEANPSGKIFELIQRDFRQNARALLEDWISKKLFHVTDKRWCRHCASHGHTFLSCPNEQNPAPSGESQLSRSTLKDEKSPSPTKPSTTPSNQDHTENHLAKKHPEKRMKVQSVRPRRCLKNFNYDSFLHEVERDKDGFYQQRKDAYHPGVIRHLEAEGPNQGGLIVSSTMERSLWFNVAGNRIGFGLKGVRPGEKVWFRLKQNEEKHFSAVQVSPVDPTLEDDDITGFLLNCESSEDPCNVMGQILTSENQWVQIVKRLRTQEAYHTEIFRFIKFIAHVGVLGTASIIAKTDFMALKEIVHRKNPSEATVFVPAFLRSDGMLTAYVKFFLTRILRLGAQGEAGGIAEDLSISTQQYSLFDILREMLLQDVQSKNGNVNELIQLGVSYFPRRSDDRALNSKALHSREMVFILKLLLGISVLLQLNSNTKKLMMYMVQIIGKTLAIHKTPRELSIFIPVLQAIHVTLSSMDSVIVSSFRALHGDSIENQTIFKDAPSNIIQVYSERISLRAEEIQYPLTDHRNPFHLQNIADLGVRRHSLFQHLHAHYIAIRSEFYMQLVRIMRTSLFGDDWFPQAKDTPGVKEPAALENIKPRSVESEQAWTRDVVRDVRLLGFYIDHSYALCPVFDVRINNIRGHRDAFTRGSLLTFVTGFAYETGEEDMDGPPRRKIDPSEVFSLCVNDALTLADRIIMSVRAVEETFPWKAFLFRIRRNEQLLRVGDSAAIEQHFTTLFLQQSFFPAFEPALKRLHNYLRLPFCDFPFSYVFGENRPIIPTLIPQGYQKAFSYIIDKLHARYQLDESQSAVMRSLRSDPVLLVQGPPGTGKSFVGTRIVEAFTDFHIQLGKGLLSNLYEVGDSIQEGTPAIGPILIITFKNHALDEFLKDILGTGLWCEGARGHYACACSGDNRGCCTRCCKHEKKVVRIGTRINDKTILQHSLGELLKGVEKQPSYMDSLKRSGILKDRIRSIFRKLEEMKRGRIPSGLLLKYFTEGQRASFLVGTGDISKETDSKESYLDAFGNDILVNTGTALEYRRWLQGEERQAIFDPSLEGKCTVQAIEEQISKNSIDHSSTIREKLTEKNVLRHADIPKDEVAAGDLKPLEADAGHLEESKWESILDGLPVENSHVHSSFDVDFAFDTTSFAFDFDKVLTSSEDGILPDAPCVPSLSAICPWVLSQDERYEFVAQIIEFEVSSQARDIAKLVKEYRATREYTKRVRQEEEIQILRQADVIAATSTGCTMHIEHIKQISPSVIIVEEAAEILEAHVISCLTASMKQIILIGDHQQLRPRIDNYDLIEHHHVNVSLFERLADEKYPLIRLNKQRRMQKEIADLIRPFYAQNDYALEDHCHTLDAKLTDLSGVPFVSTPGLLSKACLWDHDYPEEKSDNSHSIFNEAETAMAIYLTNFLLLQNVRPTSVTIITPYLAQQRSIIKALRKHVLCDPHLIKVVTIDRFQGDENDIIILSLVRTRNLTDFLQLENRMIVACSRARHQLIILGSSKLLQKSAHWNRVLSILGKHIYKKLPLFNMQSRNHHHYITGVAVQDEFSSANAEFKRMGHPAWMESHSSPACYIRKQ
ncbi:RNA helicase [Perkinsela sp. CCAP 1560/4]|nr:RNA helicase [Perkinsela sp. CCAP 1560/4]|eukprot:KNH09663.1 RNA helicase [Perkinsela sp. CCAP 1560/4]